MRLNKFLAIVLIVGASQTILSSSKEKFNDLMMKISSPFLNKEAVLNELKRALQEDKFLALMQNKYGDTLLHIAMKESNVPATKELAPLSDKELKDIFGDNAYSLIGTMQGHLQDEMSRIIFGEENDEEITEIKMQELQNAIAMNDLKTIENELRKNPKIALAQDLVTGDTLLHTAVKRANIKAIKLLLRYSEIDKKNNKNENVFNIAMTLPSQSRQKVLPLIRQRDQVGLLFSSNTLLKDFEKKKELDKMVPQSIREKRSEIFNKHKIKEMAEIPSKRIRQKEAIEKWNEEHGRPSQTF